MRVLGLLLAPLVTAQPDAFHTAVPMEVRVPYQVGDCVRAVKDIDYEDLHGASQKVMKRAKGTLVHVAPDHVVVKWNNKETLARAAAFPHQVKREVWPKGNVASIEAWSPVGDAKSEKHKCMTVVEYHGFAPLIKAMPCVDKWQNQQFTTPLACRPGPIYWKKDPSLCVDAVHPEVVQLMDCDGRESQMFALASDHKNNPAAAVNTNEGFMVGTGNTDDMCFNFDEDGSVKFGKCTSESTKFQFEDFDQSSD